jgi:hypothetical protein
MIVSCWKSHNTDRLSLNWVLTYYASFAPADTTALMIVVGGSARNACFVLYCTKFNYE